MALSEHRYYGESVPDPHDLSFLTVEQSLSDCNTLAVHMRRKWKMPAATAFVVFGGSYGGNLALWLRLKNPNLWAGAVASSATPLKHLLRQTNGFARIETEVYGNVSSFCPELVRAGWRELYGKATTAAGRAEIARKLGLCHQREPPVIRADRLHGWIGEALETLVQYGYPYPTDFYNPVPAYPFAVACRRMLAAGNSGLAALRAAVDVYYNYTGQVADCYDYHALVEPEWSRHWQRKGDASRLYGEGAFLDDSVPVLKRREHGETSSRARMRQAEQQAEREQLSVAKAWGYQTCTEVYQPMPTNGVTDFELPHTPNKTAYFEHCSERFGVHPRPDWEEMTFMGENIQSGSNIFLTSGQLDPWRAAGIQTQPRGSSPESIIVRIIEHGAHHLDLRASHPADPDSVVAVRKEEKAAIRRWIEEWQQLHQESS